MQRFDHAGAAGSYRHRQSPDTVQLADDDFLAGEQSRLELALAAVEQRTAANLSEPVPGLALALRAGILLAVLGLDTSLLREPLISLTFGGTAPEDVVGHLALYFLLVLVPGCLACLGYLALRGFAPPDEVPLLVRVGGRLATITLIALFLAYVGRYQLFPQVFDFGAALSWGARASDAVQSLLAILLLPLCVGDFSEGMGAEVGALLRRRGLRQQQAELRQRRDAVLQARRSLRADPALLLAPTHDDSSEPRFDAPHFPENPHV